MPASNRLSLLITFVLMIVLPLALGQAMLSSLAKLHLAPDQAILLIIAIRMVFASGGEVYAAAEGREPFIFPLAVPLLAGPSAMATVLLLASRQPERLWTWMGALTVAMAVSGAVLLAADRIRKLLGSSMVAAIEKLMGLVLTAIAVEMILAGLKRYFFSAP